MALRRRALVRDPELPDCCRFAYKVKLRGGGVTHREATYSVIADQTGVLTFDYKWDFYHAWYEVRASFHVFAEAEEGKQTLEVIQFHNRETTGPRSFCGSVAIRVVAGRRFGLRLGGSNYDSDSRLEGTLIVSRFTAPLHTEEFANIPGLPNSPRTEAR